MPSIHSRVDTSINIKEILEKRKKEKINFLKSRVITISRPPGCPKDKAESIQSWVEREPLGDNYYHINS